MNVNLRFYYIASIIKVALWLTINIVTYSFINVYEDPVIAISLWFIGVFILIWWISFFLFLLWQKLFRKNQKERIVKDSYKLSLLFGIYAIINILLIFLWAWNRIWWIILLWGFILIQILLLENKEQIENEEWNN